MVSVTAELQEAATHAEIEPETISLCVSIARKWPEPHHSPGRSINIQEFVKDNPEFKLLRRKLAKASKSRVDLEDPIALFLWALAKGVQFGGVSLKIE